MLSRPPTFDLSRLAYVRYPFLSGVSLEYKQCSCQGAIIPASMSPESSAVDSLAAHVLPLMQTITSYSCSRIDLVLIGS